MHSLFPDIPKSPGRRPGLVSLTSKGIWRLAKYPASENFSNRRTPPFSNRRAILVLLSDFIFEFEFFGLGPNFIF
jgi:hypothetical protein